MGQGVVMSGQPVGGAPMAYAQPPMGKIVVVQPPVQQTLQVQVPDGYQQGGVLQTTTPDGRVVSVDVPAGTAPGSVLAVSF